MHQIAALVESLRLDYEFVRQIGEGGMALVFLARDLKHGRLVAIKVCKPDIAANVGAARFLREIRTLANLSHPHVLPLHDSGSAGGFLYYVMPYIEGESLRVRLDRGPLAREEVLSIVHHMAEALDYAHGQGVVHRDVKPENVLIHHGNAIVADFGIARALAATPDPDADSGSLTQTGMIVGSPRYMSPEQVSGSQALDGRSDQYSMACVVCEMLTGSPPFGGTTPEALIVAHLVEKVPRLVIHKLPVAPAVQMVLEQALSKSADDRYHTMRAFADALEQSLSAPESNAVHAAPSLPPINARRTRWQSWRWPIAAMLLLSAGAIPVWKMQRASEQRAGHVILRSAREDFFAGQYQSVISTLAGGRREPLNPAANEQEALRYLARAYVAVGRTDSARLVLKQLLGLEPPVVLLLPDDETLAVWRLYVEERREKALRQTVRPMRASVAEKPIVAVYPFMTMEGVPDSYIPLARGVQELIITELSNSAALRVVEREGLARKRRVRDTSFDAIDSSGNRPILKETHAVFGTFNVHDDQLFVTTWLLDVNSGELAYLQQLQSPIQKLSETVGIASSKLAAALGSKPKDLPSSTILHLAAREDVCRTTNAVGDKFLAELQEDVRGQNGTVVPSGTLVTFRIDRLRNGSNDPDSIAFWASARSLELGGTHVDLSGTSADFAMTTREEGSGSGRSIFIPGRSHECLKKGGRFDVTLSFGLMLR